MPYPLLVIFVITHFVGYVALAIYSSLCWEKVTDTESVSKKKILKNAFFYPVLAWRLSQNFRKTPRSLPWQVRHLRMATPIFGAKWSHEDYQRDVDYAKRIQKVIDWRRARGRLGPPPGWT